MKNKNTPNHMLLVHPYPCHISKKDSIAFLCQMNSDKHTPYDDLPLQAICLNGDGVWYAFSMLKRVFPPVFMCDFSCIILTLSVSGDKDSAPISVMWSNILTNIFHINTILILDQFFISQVPLGYCNSNLILQYNINWRKKNIKHYLSRRVIFIRSDLSLRQHNKNVSVIFILAKISLAYSKQKMSLSGGLKFPLEIIESHYKACTMKLLWVAPISYYKHIPTQSSTFSTSVVT